MARLLELRDVAVRYGEIPGLRNLSMSVAQGEVVALLGANGAGKTTALKAIMGMVKLSAGSIQLDGQDVAGRGVHMAARNGIALVPEGRRIFKRMTVRENLDVGGVTRSRTDNVQVLEEVFVMFPRLRERAQQLAGTLSGGEQQMLAIGRALMAKPSFILFDEPSLGLAPIIVESVLQTIRRISAELGVGGILVEQNVAAALAFGTRAYVLNRGSLVLSGLADAVRASPELHQAYLGMGH